MSSNGTPTGILAESIAVVERFAKKLDITPTCWEFRLPSLLSDTSRYAFFGVRGKSKLAHRIMYELTTGKEIKQRMVIDHICRNTRCGNPLHLREIDQRQNLIDGFHGHGCSHGRPLKEFCIRGHRISEDKYERPSGRRECNKCRQWRQRKAKKICSN